MSTADSSGTTTDPSWSTTGTQPTAQQWQTQEQYQQYYNYYQAMNQAPVATTTAAAAPSDQTATYTQDYTKAWDEYYKAYYGQSYAANPPTTQYPATGYSYDQYGYPNLAAPPPAYQYESVTTPTTYQYSQPPQAATTASNYPYTNPSNTAPPASTWSEPPPSFEKPTSYNASQSYQQYDKQSPSFDQGNSYSNGTPNNNNQNDNYLERFPPPPFDTGNRGFGNRGGNFRGRGSNKDNRDDNFRRPPRGQNNRGPNQRGNFNDRSQYDERPQVNNNIRSQYNNYDQSNYNSNDYQSNGSTFRGRRGGSSYRDNGEESLPRGRGGAPFRGNGGLEFNNKRFSSGEYKHGYNNNNANNFDEQSWNTGDNFDQNNDFDATSESPWNVDEGAILPGWSSQKKRPMMDYNNSEHIRPMPLMDIVVRPTVQSSIVMRRQALIDQWQNAVRKIADCNMPMEHHWVTIKSALLPDVQSLLSPSFVNGENIVHCEVHLDDIFLVQSKGHNEDAAIEDAGKILWEMLQDRLYVRTASRGWATDKVPVFCLSRSASAPVSVPPIIAANMAPRDNMTGDIVCNKNNSFTQRIQSAAVVDKSDNEKPETSVISFIQKAVNTDKSLAIAPVTVPTSKPQNYAQDDIFLVVDSAQSDKDQSISVLNNTAKFNKISIEYKHEKPENATHISQCLITINGQQFEMSEARDYLVAKREAADKAVSIFKLSCPQITLGFDRATELVKADIVQSGKSIEEAACEWLKKFASSDEDTIYRLSQLFTNQERDAISKMASNLNLSTKQEGNGVLFIFRQYLIEDMKKRILRQGYCAQYRLVIDESTGGNKSV